MSFMTEDINYLCSDIGPRPAGTEEERRAAMYVAENISKRSGLNINIEDFEGARGRDRVFRICAFISALLIVISSLLPIITIPAFILTLICAIIVVLEALGKPILSGFMRYGVSQNVVAKYEPTYSSEKNTVQRKRKIVLVTHYDSGHSVDSKGTAKVSAGYVIKLASIFVCCIIPVVLLLKAILFSDATGSTSLIFLVAGIILAVIAIIPTIYNIVISKSEYNEGANCNASGTAVLMEIARLLGTGAFGAAAEGATPAEPRVHGGEAAAASGLIPKGAEVNYSAQPNIPQEPAGGYFDPNAGPSDALEAKEAALQSAKAAVAAFVAPRAAKQDDAAPTNNPTIGGVQKPADSQSSKIPDAAKSAPEGQGSENSQTVESGDSSQKLAGVTIDDAAAQRSGEAKQYSSTPRYIGPASTGGVPSWYAAAQNKAKAKSGNESARTSAAPVRSRFAHTMDAMAQRREEAQRQKEEEEERKRAELRAQIEAANIAAIKKEEEEIGPTSQFFRTGVQAVAGAQDARSQGGAQKNMAENTAQIPAAATVDDSILIPSTPNVESSKSADSKAVQSSAQVEVEKLSLDERFKRRQMGVQGKVGPSTSAPVETQAEAPNIDASASSVPVSTAGDTSVALAGEVPPVPAGDSSVAPASDTSVAPASETPSVLADQSPIASAVEATTVPSGDSSVAPASETPSVPADQPPIASAVEVPSVPAGDSSVAPAGAFRNAAAPATGVSDVADSPVDAPSEIPAPTSGSNVAQKTAPTTSSAPSQKPARRLVSVIPDEKQLEQLEQRRAETARQRQEAAKRKEQSAQLRQQALKEREEIAMQREQAAQKYASTSFNAPGQTQGQEPISANSEGLYQSRDEVDLGATMGMPPADSIAQDDIYNQDLSQPLNPPETVRSQPSLRPENSGAINIIQNKQYAPLDDQDFMKTPEVSGQDHVAGTGAFAPSSAENEVIPEDSNEFLPGFNSILDEQSRQSTPSSQYDAQAKLDDQLPPISDSFAAAPDAVPSRPEQGFSQSSSAEVQTDSPFAPVHEKGKFGTGSFKAVAQNEGIAGATGTFTPVTDELIAESAASAGQDIYVDDADETAFSKQEYTDAGAFAGEGYLDMPDQNKRKGLFGRFKKKNKKGGRHFGGSDNKDNLIDDSAWEGGAFSNLASKIPGVKKAKSDVEPDIPQGANSGDVYEDDTYGQNFGATGGIDVPDAYGARPETAFAEDNRFNTNAPITSEENRISSMLDPVPNFDEQIQEFHEGSINLEVWMVALGSEIDENSGIRNFLVEHAQELRGAIIVDIEGLGAGELSVVESEGLIKRSKVNSRMLRYVRRAANKIGVSVPSVRIPWSSSAASFANNYDFSAIRFCGMKNGKPAYYLQDDDTPDIIDENLLQENVKFLLQFIQSV